MNKQEAAEFLGVTPRTLTNYVAAGKLSPHYIKGKTSPVAEFDPDELQAVKPQMAIASNMEKVEEGDGSPSEGGKEEGRISYFGKRAPKMEKVEIPTSETALALVPRPAFDVSETNARTQDTSPHAPANWTINLAAKLLLTVAEAHTLTGLSQSTLREAIKSGELKALKIGRSQRLRPQDVRAWINAKFGD